MVHLQTSRDPQYLRGIVDMGSNGIRFSITTLQPPTARIMPTLYAHRLGISLYDAQHDRTTSQVVPIDTRTIEAVIAALLQFRQTCEDFGVLSENVTILATEATRTAQNSIEFRSRITEAVGWQVTMLSKEEEGRIGAMGVASSLPAVSGLVMDLGGGSTQLTWLVKEVGQPEVRMPLAGSSSMPYGAAAMSMRLEAAQRRGTVEQLKDEVTSALRQAYNNLEIPTELAAKAEQDGGYSLYLSGGGFRGWGYMLMDKHALRPYPIAAINGFKAGRESFLNTLDIRLTAAQKLANDGDVDIFRVSERRASQIPAVAFLIDALSEALPTVREICFCQGGVREGFLFSSLPPAIRSQHPLIIATQSFGDPATTETLRSLLVSSIPASEKLDVPIDDQVPFSTDLLEAFANLAYYHTSHSRDLQGSAALRMTTSGALAAVHGLLHESRALLALLLCARWNGDISPADLEYKASLERLIKSPWTLWWVNYVGAVAALVTSIYPAGLSNDIRSDRVLFQSEWTADERGRRVLALTMTSNSLTSIDYHRKHVSAIERVGKRKAWIGGRDGIGHRVTVTVATL